MNISFQMNYATWLCSLSLGLKPNLLLISSTLHSKLCENKLRADGHVTVGSSLKGQLCLIRPDWLIWPSLWQMLIKCWSLKWNAKEISELSLRSLSTKELWKGDFTLENPETWSPWTNHCFNLIFISCFDSNLYDCRWISFLLRAESKVVKSRSFPVQPGRLWLCLSAHTVCGAAGFAL